MLWTIGSMPRQTRKTYRRTFIREWRKDRNLTLQALVDRLEAMFGYETTSATLSRVEKGLQPYSQPLLEAISDALTCQPADLLMRLPGQEDEIRLVWSQLSPEKRKQAIGILKLLKDGTGG